MAATPASTLPDSHQRQALMALGLAARELAEILLGADAARQPEIAEPEAVWRAGASGPLSPTALDEFLRGDCLATLSCVKEDGYPYSVPVWYQWEGGQFWLVPRARAAWASYVQLDPRVSLAISEHQPPLRRVLVEGQARPVEGSANDERARRLVASMAVRYLGQAAASYLESDVAQPRLVFVVLPEKVVTWRGLAPHARYQSAHMGSAVGKGQGGPE